MFGFAPFSRFPLSGVIATGPAPPIIIFDTHDGDEKRKKRLEAESEVKKKRRAEIVNAFERIVEGRPELAREIAIEFAPDLKTRFLKPQYELPAKRIEKIAANETAADRIWRKFLEMDDEEVILLL